MHTSDKNILRLIELLKFQNKITTTANFCEVIGMQPGTVSKIANGKNHFTVSHIEAICKKYKVNANFIYGFEDVVFRDKSMKKISDFSFNLNDLTKI